MPGSAALPALALLFALSIASPAEGRGEGEGGAAATPALQATPDPAFEAALRRPEGFCGADGAGSVPLAPDRALWLFGDTFLGRIEAGRRAGCTLVNNTAAIARRKEDGAWAFRYLWRTKAGKPAPFFPPLLADRYFWPLHGARLGDRLYVFLMEIEATGANDPFGFRVAGNALALVDDPDRDPALWRPRIVRVPHARAETGDTILWGNAVLPRGRDVWVYGYRERKGRTGEVKRELVCARAPRRMEDFSRWRVNLAPLADGMAVEGSVTNLPGGGVLLCHTANLFDPTVILRRAPGPGRPFGPPARAYTPPLPPGRKGFAYAAKLHPECVETEEEKKKGALLTWVVNSYDFFELLSDASLYWPRATRIRGLEE